MLSQGAYVGIAVASGVVVGVTVFCIYKKLKENSGDNSNHLETEPESQERQALLTESSMPKADQSPTTSPPARTTLEDYGYHFHKGKLRQIGDDSAGFVFVDQEQYEAIGELVEEEVYKMLEEECQLLRLNVPRTGTGPHTFIFASEDWMENENLMILIHGSGVVRAGQWTRKLIINESVESGTQIPYIKRARQLDYAVLVLNTNDNRCDGVRIPESKTPEQHGRYVWENFIQSPECKARHVAIVAHSYGGVVTMSMLEGCTDFQHKVFAIGFTDSVHSSRLSHTDRAYFQQVAKNWVSSSQAVGTDLDYSRGDCALASAGTTDHIWTSHCAIDEVFEFIQQKKLERVPEPRSKRDVDTRDEVIDTEEQVIPPKQPRKADDEL